MFMFKKICEFLQQKMLIFYAFLHLTLTFSRCYDNCARFGKLNNKYGFKANLLTSNALSKYIAVGFYNVV